MIRRVLVTGTVTIATLLGTAGIAAAAPQAPRALRAAETDTAPAPAPALSVSSVRPGTAFTVSPPVGCPATDGEQGVFITYTDSEDTTFGLDYVLTDDDGSWDAVTVRLPVAGPDADGAWDDAEVAKGPGSIETFCLSSQYTMAKGKPSFSSMAPGTAVIDPDRRTLEDPEDDEGDDDGETDSVTLSYAPAALTVSGVATRVAVTPGLTQPGGRITVSPVDVCDGSVRTARIQVSPVALTEDDPGSDDDSGDDGGDDSGDDDIDGLGAEADADAVVTTELEVAAGSWAATTLQIPSGTELGDYAVIVDCLDADREIGSRYAAVPLALGTVTAAAPVCSAKGASVRLSGSYPGTLLAGDDDLALPATLKLTGSGPWNVVLDSALTGGVLLKQKVSCPEPDYELSVPRTGLTSSGAVRARVCNTGDATAHAILQVAAKGKKFVTVDRATLDDGNCAWLDGGKVKKGSSAKGRVLMDPPGKGTTDQEAVESFSVRRKG